MVNFVFSLLRSGSNQLHKYISTIFWLNWVLTYIYIFSLQVGLLHFSGISNLLNMNRSQTGK